MKEGVKDLEFGEEEEMAEGVLVVEESGKKGREQILKVGPTVVIREGRNLNEENSEPTRVVPLSPRTRSPSQAEIPKNF